MLSCHSLQPQERGQVVSKGVPLPNAQGEVSLDSDLQGIGAEGELEGHSKGLTRDQEDLTATKVRTISLPTEQQGPNNNNRDLRHLGRGLKVPFLEVEEGRVADSPMPHAILEVAVASNILFRM